MNDLVIINRNKQAVASHIVISEGMCVTQNSTLKLIKKYKNDLSQFGKVVFQNVPLESGQKQKQSIYYADIMEDLMGFPL